MVTEEKLLKQLEEWMDWLETPNEDFGGYPVCPFLAPERKTNQLLIEFYNPDKGSIFDLIKLSLIRKHNHLRDKEHELISEEINLNERF